MMIYSSHLIFHIIIDNSNLTWEKNLTVLLWSYTLDVSRDFFLLSDNCSKKQILLENF